MINAKFKKVTLWYKHTQELVGCEEIKTVWEFNHLEDGHADLYQQRPLPIKPEFKEQAKEWKHGVWAKRSAYLIDGVVHEISGLIHITDNGKLQFISDITGEQVCLDKM